MAILTEEPDPPKPSTQTTPKPLSKSKSKAKAKAKATASSPPSSSSSTNSTNPFEFWFYFTLTVSLIALFFISLPSFSPQDPKTWFLNLPPNLRQHYSKGRIFKVQLTPNHPQVEAFSIQDGPFSSDHRVLILHGFGCSSFAFQGIVKSLGLKGVHATAIDLPGSGFSDKSMVVVEENVGGSGGVLGGFWEVYGQIKEKGLFWGFDQLIEKGYVDYEENDIRVSKREVVKAIELGHEEMGRVLSQVIDAMGLAPVDLVLHDSALGLSANWISENARLVRSVTLLDSVPSRTALPSWALELPVVREAVLGVGLVFQSVLGKYCLKSVGKAEAEAHRILLKGRNGRRSVVGMVKRVNRSLDLSEWGGLNEVKDLPMRVIWSSGSSKEWIEVGSRVADALSQAALVSHSGGAWPQEHVSEEIAEIIYEFISALPKSTRQSEEEPIPEHIQIMLDDAKSSDHHHHDHHHHDHHHGHDGHDHGHDGHDSHGHGHAHAGYSDAYGLGHGWGV